MIRVSLLTTLVIYNDYFKSHQVWKQRPRTHVLYVKLLRLYNKGKKPNTTSSPIGYWSKGSNLDWYFRIFQGSSKIPYTCNRLIIDQWILGSGDLKFT